MGFFAGLLSWVVRGVLPVWLKWTAREVDRYRRQALVHQEEWFWRLLRVGRWTAYGRQYGFGEIRSYDEYRRRVPLVQYEDLLPWIARIQRGEENVLWRGRPMYFAKTAGTTARTKYIPLTREALRFQIRAAREAVFLYAWWRRSPRLFTGKMLFLSGSPDVEMVGEIPAGRLSGIVHRHVPRWVLRNRLPPYEVNRLSPWEKKLARIVDLVLAHRESLTLISGIPPWIVMFLEWIEARTGEMPGKLFPRLEVYVHGGVQFRPYRDRLRGFLPDVWFWETYPASEGFFAYQDEPEKDEEHPGLLLLTNHGIFYEFIPLEEVHRSDPSRYWLGEVEPNHPYELVVTTCAGLWAYRTGDLVRFESCRPYRLRVVGRARMTLSPFGEHVLVEELEQALAEACRVLDAEVREFTVSAVITPEEGKRPYHVWVIEFGGLPRSWEQFVRVLDEALQRRNPYYADLRQGKILALPEVRVLSSGAFQSYLSQIGKIGEQYKVPRVDPEGRHVKELDAWVQQVITIQEEDA